MTQTVEHYLALVTLAMPFVLGAAHAFRAFAEKLFEHAVTTSDKRDDAIMLRIIGIADWIETIARAVAHCASMGFFLRSDDTNPTPSLERVEGGE